MKIQETVSDYLIKKIIYMERGDQIGRALLLGVPKKKRNELANRMQVEQMRKDLRNLDEEKYND